MQGVGKRDGGLSGVRKLMAGDRTYKEGTPMHQGVFGIMREWGVRRDGTAAVVSSICLGLVMEEDGKE